ncbi:MAG TPA: RdgB/HAM1 family non-canonical purine NTP pyrophosphatase [Clostridiaceae bacterium]|nr:RdgB/HAM1 family non-canonical purine NTP pyrophosphatase [Clostridiaceae bacterium]
MKIILASHNSSKLTEFRTLVKGYPVSILGLQDIGFEQKTEETGDTFDENALIKAKAVRSVTNDIVMADDSGLCVDALDGAPGIMSARFGGLGIGDDDKNTRLLDLLEKMGDVDRTAAFHCSLAVIFPDGRQELFSGVCRGTIAKEPKGTNGFGYDPVFIPAGERRTLAEMKEGEKHAISHRGKAVRAFLCALFTDCVPEASSQTFECSEPSHSRKEVGGG